MQVQDPIANGRTKMDRPMSAETSKHAEWQILNRKVRVRRVCRLDPAAKARIVGLVNHPFGNHTSPSGSIVDAFTSLTTMLVRMRSTPSTFISFSKRNRSR